jgi:phosphoglycerate dehydrogenase-like enzyme
MRIEWIKPFLAEATRGMIGERELDLLEHEPVPVNVSRGPSSRRMP